MPLGQVQRVRFLKPALEQEFRKALAVDPAFQGRRVYSRAVGYRRSESISGTPGQFPAGGSPEALRARVAAPVDVGQG